MKNGSAVGLAPFNVYTDGDRVISRGTYATSVDGITWDGPRGSAVKIPWIGPKSEVTLSQHGVTLHDGELLAGFYATTGVLNRTTSGLIHSTNGGTTWEYYATIARPADAPWGNEGVNEPGIVALSNGDLLSIMRTGSGGAGDTIKTSTSMLQARSKDKGKTWTRHRLGANGVYPQLLEMSNGVLACTFGRPGNSIMFSLDQGASWVRETALTPADLKTSGYADLVEVSPGRLLVVYDAFNTTLQKFWLWEPPNPINVIYGVFIDVKVRGDKGS